MCSRRTSTPQEPRCHMLLTQRLPVCSLCHHLRCMITCNTGRLAIAAITVPGLPPPELPGKPALLLPFNFRPHRSTVTSSCMRRSAAASCCAGTCSQLLQIFKLVSAVSCNRRNIPHSSGWSDGECTKGQFERPWAICIVANTADHPASHPNAHTALSAKACRHTKGYVNCVSLQP